LDSDPTRQIITKTRDGAAYQAAQGIMRVENAMDFGQHGFAIWLSRTAVIFLPGHCHGGVRAEIIRMNLRRRDCCLKA